MLKKRMVHKDITDINIYTAKRIRDMAESLNGLAKTFGKLKGEPGLTREDGIAALEAASAAETFTTHASRTARPFLEHRGWRVVREQTVLRRGVALNNFVMEKFRTR